MRAIMLLNLKSQNFLDPPVKPEDDNITKPEDDSPVDLRLESLLEIGL